MRETLRFEHLLQTIPCQHSDSPLLLTNLFALVHMGFAEFNGKKFLNAATCANDASNYYFLLCLCILLYYTFTTCLTDLLTAHLLREMAENILSLLTRIFSL